MAKAATRKKSSPKLSSVFWEHFKEHTIQVLTVVLTSIGTIFTIGFYSGKFYGEVNALSEKVSRFENLALKKDTVFISVPNVKPTIEVDSSVINKIKSLNK